MAEPALDDYAVMLLLIEAERKASSPRSFVFFLQRFQQAFSSTLAKWGMMTCPASETGWLDSWHAARDRWAKANHMSLDALVNPPDPVICAQLPDGVTFVGSQTQYRGISDQMRRGRVLQTLSNIESGLGGTLGYFLYGDVGSDIGAVTGRGVGAIAQAGTQKLYFKALSEMPVEPATSGYVMPVRTKAPAPPSSDRGTSSRGTPAKPAAPPPSPPPPSPPPPSPPPPSPRQATASKSGGPNAASSPRAPRSNAVRAASRAQSSADAAAGGKLTPKVRAKLKQARVDVDDAYTEAKLNEIYAANRDDSGSLVTARANSGELRTLMREARTPGVKSVKFLQPTNTQRTPDIEVTLEDGSTRYVEVRTITGAYRSATVASAKTQRAPISAEFILSVQEKLRRGQLSPQRPGKIVFHAPFQPITDDSLDGWRTILSQIRSKSPLGPGIQRIEVSGAPDKDGTTKLLVFQSPDWKGVIVK